MLQNYDGSVSMSLGVSCTMRNEAVFRVIVKTTVFAATTLRSFV